MITLPGLTVDLTTTKKTRLPTTENPFIISRIYCVGSRQPEGENTYCSRYCCTATIHAAIQVRDKFGDIQNYHFTRGVRSYGKQELLYAESLQGGDIYLRHYEDGLPVVCQKQQTGGAE